MIFLLPATGSCCYISLAYYCDYRYQALVPFRRLAVVVAVLSLSIVLI